MDPYVIDTTLRDGEQAPGVAFSLAGKLEIASLLDALGVDEVEAGTPAIGREETEAIRQIASSGFSFVTSAWCRANIHDIEHASRLGLGAVNISLPVSDIQIDTLGKSRRWVLDELRKILTTAKGIFPHVTIGAQDASRADTHFLHEFIFNAFDGGAKRIRLSDTVGVCDMYETRELIERAAESFPTTDFEFHGHNDLGMATANTLAALRAGARCFSGTIGGIGERAGNAAIEQIIAILRYKYGINRFHTEVLHLLGKMVSNLSGRPVPIDRPITGDHVFTHESGIHTSAILKNPQSYQFLNPADFGPANTQFSFGKHSGSAAVEALISSRGIQLDKDALTTLVRQIKERALTFSRSLTAAEVIQMGHQIFALKADIQKTPYRSTNTNPDTLPKI